MEVGVSTCCVDTGENTIIDHLVDIKKAGFNIIEIDGHNYSSFPYLENEFIENLKKVLLRLKIRINSIHAPFHLSITDPDKNIREEAIATILKFLHCIKPLEELTEKGFLIIHPGHHLTRTPAHIQQMLCLESLKIILENNPLSRLKPSVENMLSSHYGGKASELKLMVETFGKNRLSICLDTSHSVYDSNPVDFLSVVEPYISTTHLSDNYNQSRGEFHAIPMTLKHSCINWLVLMKELTGKLDTLIFELNKPYYLDNFTFLKMARLAADRLKDFIPTQ
ncbi:MAG: sugar phosphate isomerase/epimerase family protein [Vulcanimicrobiota bacterium]